MTNWKPIATAPKDGKRIILQRPKYPEDPNGFVERHAICWWSESWQEWMAVNGASFSGANKWTEIPE